MSNGKLFVISGPSGAGKGSVIEKFFEINNNTKLSISATTRSPRKGELEGVHYYFFSLEKFERLISKNELIEYTKFCDNYYGTPLAQVQTNMKMGENTILEIETDGAMQVKNKFPEAILIFIAPPSIEELEKRLKGRGTESHEIINKRLQTAKKEMKLTSKYDHVLINQTIQDTALELNKIINNYK